MLCYSLVKSAKAAFTHRATRELRDPGVLVANLRYRFYGVMVSTQDSESCDPSSNLGRTLERVFVPKHIVLIKPLTCCMICKTLAAVGFEPTPPRRLVP